MFHQPQCTKFRPIQVVVCVVLLACILAIIVLPQIDILPSTLRTQRGFSSLLFQLFALALVFSFHLRAVRSRHSFLSFRETFFRLLPSRLSIICVRLC